MGRMTTTGPISVLDAVEDHGLDVAPVPPPSPVSEAAFVEWVRANDVRAEWVDGEIELMNAVATGHGGLVWFLGPLIRLFAEAHDLGEVTGEPVHVRLPSQRRRRSPDLFCYGPAKRPQLLDEHFEGAPDLVIEVVSPESRRTDTVTKFREYEAAGVPEYWLPDPTMRSFAAFSLGVDGRYVRLPEVDGAVYSARLPGLFFRPEWVWQLRPPPILPLLAEMAAERAMRLANG